MSETVELPKVDKLLDAEQLMADLSFKETELSEAMMEQATLFARYSTLAARAQRQADRFKMLLDVTIAKTAKRLRDRLAVSGEKVVESRIEKDLAMDLKVITMKERLAEAEMIATLTKQVLEAFKQRRDMLVQIGVWNREEMKGELRLASIEASSRGLKGQAADIVQRLKSA